MVMHANSVHSLRRQVVASVNKPFHIAIVDDDESICKALKRLLNSAGFEATSFDGGSEFLRAVVTRPPDCVLLDVHMPGMTGIEVLARLHDVKVDVPVIIITAYDDRETYQKAREAGAVFLRKPFNDQALLDAIHHALGDVLGPQPVSGDPK
jgi:FixJ family two-component response regulator